MSEIHIHIKSKLNKFKYVKVRMRTISVQGRHKSVYKPIGGLTDKKWC